MKRKISFCLVLAFCLSIFLIPVSADNGTIISVVRTDLDDGSYYIETVTEYPSVMRSASKTGSKTKVCYSSDGDEIFSVSVYGEFTYTGSSAEATSATGYVQILDYSAKYVSKSVSTSGAKATATGKVKYNSETLSTTVTLTCSATGVLS